MADFYNRIQTAQLLAEQIKIDVSKDILRYEPYGTPLTVLLAQMRTIPTESTTFRMFEDVMPPTTSKVLTTQTVLTTLVVLADEGKFFTEGILVSVPLKNEIFRVTAIATDTLTIVRDWGGTGTGDLLAAGTDLIILKEARAEGDAPSTSRGIKITPRDNNVEEFSTTIEETDIAAAVAYYTQNPRAYARVVKGVEHKEKIERALMFGKKAEIWDAGTRRMIRTTNGLISTLLAEAGVYKAVSIGTLTESDFDKTILPNIYKYNQNDKRVGLVSTPILSAITGFAKNKLVVNDQKSKQYGLHISTYKSGYPDLELIHQPLFTGYYSGWGIVINTKTIAYRPLKGKDTKLNPNYDKTNPHIEKDEYFTVAGLGLSLPNTFSILTGVTG